jgi:hypothetical protein
MMRIKKSPILISHRKIWDKASHNGMTDLIRHREIWYCAFREGEAHVHGENGQVRILASLDGLNWIPAALFSIPGVDLRDPKLSVTPDGKLMLLVGGIVWNRDREYETLHSRIAFSEDGRTWSPLSLILGSHDWLWRITWHKGKAYGVAYKRSVPKDRSKEWLATLYESSDGLDYSPLASFDISGHPNEATLRFRKNGEMIALLRRDSKQEPECLIGVSKEPYKDWKWYKTLHHFGGPNFLILPDNSMWAGGRIVLNSPYGFFEKTVLAKLELFQIEPILILPSGGDSSYPGMVYHDGLLWISYYSSHEGKAAIYLARVAV